MSSTMGRPSRAKYGTAGNYHDDTRAGELQVEQRRLAGVERKLAALNAHGRDLAQWPVTGKPSLIRSELETLRTIYKEKIAKYGGTP